MTEFIRSIHKCIKDLFILDTDAQCNLADHLCEEKLRIWYFPSPRFCLLSLKTTSRDQRIE